MKTKRFSKLAPAMCTAAVMALSALAAVEEGRKVAPPGDHARVDTSPPRRTDVPARGGPGEAVESNANEPKPMPNDGAAANVPTTAATGVGGVRPVGPSEDQDGGKDARTKPAESGAALAAARQALANDPSLRDLEVELSAEGGRLVVEGTVSTQRAKADVEAKVTKASGLPVANRIVVGGR